MLAISLSALALAGCIGDETDAEFRGLTAADVTALGQILNDQPLNDAQSPWPAHQITWLDQDTFFLIHHNAADPEVATEVLWIGLGVRGVFCDDDQPTPDFTHFHRAHADAYGSGHGGEPGQPGFWLLHVNVKEFNSPFGPTGPPGVHEGFSVSDIPSCPEPEEPLLPILPAEPQPSFDPAERGTRLSKADIAALAEILDDQPLNDAQSPWPVHLIHWLNDDVFFFLQLNAEVPDADRVMYVGIGVEGVFCADDRPDSDFSHFHRKVADAYGNGHGGSEGQAGYWLLHIATHDFDSPFGNTGGPGVQDTFNLSDAPTCD